MEAATEGASAQQGQQSLVSLGEQHFAESQFGDRRLTRRAVTTFDAIMRHPGGTLPAKLPRKELLGFYDFANNPKVDHANVLAAHAARTRRLMEANAGLVLVIHDTTEADYSGLDVPDLGPIGNGGCRGLLLHNVLAFDYANREALGLVGQVVHRRRKVAKRESAKAKREHPQRESRLWVKGVEAVGAVPAGATWVNLMDRGGDTFESLERQWRLGQWYVVRSKSNRRVEVLDAAGQRVPAKLHDWARRLPRLGTRDVAVAAQGDQPARAARVEVACGAAWLTPPHPKRGEHGNVPLAVWAIHVKEADAPAGAEPLEWVLLTNVPTESKADAWERVDWYECRPVVEEFHKAEKTGCGMELPQFTTRKALEVTIAMLSVAAVLLLRLRDLSRRADAATRPATDVVDASHVEALSLWRYREARADLSVRDFFYGLARLGGHLGRSCDRPPGWLVLWRGWMELQRLVEGLRLAHLKRCG
jgi:hypothetical protein